MDLPKQINNTSSYVGDDLKQRLTNKSRVSIAAASFSIYAFEALKEELEKIEELRFIFTSPTFVKDKTQKERREFFIPKLNRERNLYGTEFEIKLRNQLSQKAIAKECAEWIRQKVTFKSNISHAGMDRFLHIEDENPCIYQPFDEFSTTKLGYQKGDELCTIVNVMPASMAQAYLRAFNEQWEDDERFEDVTNKVLEYVETVYQENAPEYIYFIALYNIFNEFLEDISEDVLPDERTGFKESAIWNKLYNFQQDAALAIINKLEKYNGCILADSVGLGKTYTALAVIKYYENRNKSVLVLCPKRLNDNWTTFKENYVNNPIASDRLGYTVLYHSDLSRQGGKTNGIDLDRLNWGNFGLVVIDESHNFRNGGNVDEDIDKEDDEEEKGKENRYTRLMNRVIRAGVKTKVLMISATPVNNRFNDLRNQLRLAYEGREENINDTLGLGQSVDGIFRGAQKAYNQWAKLDVESRTTQRLQESLSFDFFQLLDSVTIARSRKHIQEYYDTTDIGRFPKRLVPISKQSPLTDLKKAINFKDIADILNTLNLSIYTPSLYLFASARESYEIDFEGTGLISIDGRERGLRKLMATNLLKRLESSVYSFRQTLERINAYIAGTIAKIEQFEKNRTNVTIDAIEVSEGEFDSEGESDPFATITRANINLCDIDTTTWKRDLDADSERFKLLLLMLTDITPQHDMKLKMLYDNLKEKFAYPINSGNKKVLVFTAFADTANYLYTQLADRIKSEEGLNVALITGSTEGKCTIPKFKLSYNNILTCFSPISKERNEHSSNATDNIDVLIATDCISEGQNLQDCDYLINYDIHWNPTRIIQRFGRIDRIGSKNECIQLVNYWPDIKLDEYINLKGRVENRMKALSLVGPGGDNLLSPSEKNDLEYRRKQLERLKDEVIDIEDINTGVNIMDLGLNEFRLDLLEYMKNHVDIEHAPFGMNAVVEHTEKLKPGVIFILKNRNNAVNINNKNLLHPFYMVYVAEDGETVCDYLHPKRLLDIMRSLCKGKEDYDSKLCVQIKKETEDGRKMDKYSALLQKTIEGIIETKRDSDIVSLFKQGKTTALEGEIKGLDDFELICFLIIR